MLLNLPGTDLTFGIFSGAEGTLLVPSAVGVAWNAALFYVITESVLPRYLAQDLGPLRLASETALALVLVTAAETGTDLLFAARYDIPLSDGGLQEVVLLNGAVHVLIVVLAFAYRLTRHAVREHAVQAAIRQKQLQAELDRLKAQLHPHFLFNTLNGLFALALRQDADDTAEGIRRLSSMLRFMLAHSAQDTVPLEQEWSTVEDYVALQTLRFDDGHLVTDLRNEIELESGRVAVPPLLLMPLVENAFKYGTHPGKLSTIYVRLWREREALHFEVRNPIHRSREEGFGLGLANLRDRLALLYPDRHALEAERHDSVFVARLRIELPTP